MSYKKEVKVEIKNFDGKCFDEKGNPCKFLSDIESVGLKCIYYGKQIRKYKCCRKCLLEEKKHHEEVKFDYWEMFGNSYIKKIFGDKWIIYEFDENNDCILKEDSSGNHEKYKIDDTNCL